MSSGLRDLKAAFDMGRDELANGLRALPDSMPLAPAQPVQEFSPEQIVDREEAVQQVREERELEP